jgi:hypothetical protein
MDPKTECFAGLIRVFLELNIRIHRFFLGVQRHNDLRRVRDEIRAAMLREFFAPDGESLSLWLDFQNCPG